MPQTIDIEVLLAGLYAVFLLLVALALELVARHAHHRSKQMRIAGFTYHHHLDVWECPTGQQLKPIATDYVRRLVRYRARAHICNACSIKHLCTESQAGREIEHHPDSWLESEIARFHRGISLALLFLAGLLLVVEMIRHQRPMELLILSGFLVPIALLGSQLSSAFLAQRRVVVDKDKEPFRSSHESRF
jgi:hypothetical protein